MKKIGFSLIFVFILNVAEAQKKATLIIDFQDNNQKIELRFGKKKIAVEQNAAGNTVVALKMTRPQYVQLFRVPKRPELLYLFPGDTLNMRIDGKGPGQLSFQGTHASLNAYLVDPTTIQVGGGFSLGEQEYIEFLHKRVDSTVNEMLSKQFEPTFSQREKKRIAMRIYTSMVGYPNIRRRTDRGYKASEDYYRFVKDQLYQDEQMLSVKDYTDFIQYMYQMLATKDLGQYDVFNYTDATLRYVIDHVKNKEVRSHLINYYAFDFVRRNGILEADPVTRIFRRYVKDKERRRQYQVVWDAWAKITPGRIMPEIRFNDIDKNKVALSSLRGKYVYIDVWATWCKPCIAEIPNVKKMEEKLAGRNLTFLSVSIDQDVAAWKKMIVEDNFTGLQWHAPNRKFSEELMIVSIPRFILLDPEGRIVDANASRPNREETYKLLNSLEGL